MAPKQARLPRRATGDEGTLDLEAAAETKIDAVTAEPLVQGKFVEILSPDGSLRLFYNTSTLIRIATDKGGFMQPPHFREPMAAQLQRQVEQKEGRSFHFESHDTREQRGGIWQHDEDLGGLSILHRHVYFEQIIDEFYLLNPAEVFVCPACYEHYITTRYIPYLANLGRGAQYLADGETVVLDPLDVLGHMQHPSPTSVERHGDSGYGEGGQRDEEWDFPLVHVVFRRGRDWKAHMSLHHGVDSSTSADYRLRDVLCTYYSTYNRLNEEKYAAKAKAFGSAKRKLALTQQRYWQLNARYNRLRYNRIVDATETAESHPETVTVSAFGEENLMQSTTAGDDDDSDFICDDDDDSEDEYVPHYSPSSEDDDDGSDEASLDNHKVTRKRLKRARSSSSASSSSCSSSDSSSSNTSSSSDDDDECSSTNSLSCGSDDGKRHQRQLYKKGLLAPLKHHYDSRLSGEDRRFLEAAEKRIVAPSQLYDPHLSRGIFGAKQNSTSMQDVEDWDNIGEEFQVRTAVHMPRHSEARVTPSKTEAVTCPTTPPLAHKDASGTEVKFLSLDDEE